MSNTTRVLSICTGNLNRSAAFDVILSHIGKEKYEVKSCGTGKVAPLNKKMPKKMRDVLVEIGYDGSNHRSQGITRELLEWADQVVCMGNVHARFIVEKFPEFSHKVENWRVDDPHFATGTEKHREVASQIESLVKKHFL